MTSLAQIRAVPFCRSAFRFYLSPPHLLHRLRCFGALASTQVVLHLPCLATRELSCSFHFDRGQADSTVATRRQHDILILPRRCKATDKEGSNTTEKKSLVQARESPYAGLTAGEKVKEAGKDLTYTVIIIAGLAVTGFMFYMIGRELLSSQSPSGVYGDALKKCSADIDVASALGEPIKGYGETTRRGRRRHVSHTEFEVNGVPHMRMRFYIEGPYRKGTVHLEVQKGESGKYEYRYLIVETEGYPHRTFVIEDNRNKQQLTPAV